MTITQAAETAKCSRDTVKRYLRAGRFPNARRLDDVNRTWQIPLADLAEAGLTAKLAAAQGQGQGVPTQRLSPATSARDPRSDDDEAGSIEALQLRLTAAEAELRMYRALAEERAGRIQDLQLALTLTPVAVAQAAV